jgi:hypothetical protein
MDITYLLQVCVCVSGGNSGEVLQPCDWLDLRVNGDKLRAKAYATRFKRERESDIWTAALLPPTLLDKWRR